MKLLSFLQKAKEIHGTRYNYSLVDNCDDFSKIKIICKDHGIFDQTPNKHIYKHQGCAKCSGNAKLTLEFFLEKAAKIHNNKYDYSLVAELNGNVEKVKIICIKHGIFKQRPTHHMYGYGCPICGGSTRLTLEEVVVKAKAMHGDKYDYSLSEYVNNSTKIKIICGIHGKFLQGAKSHMRGAGCPLCKQTKNEKKTGEYLSSILSSVAIQNHKLFKIPNANVSGRVFVDFYFKLNSKEYIIEYNGKQHYEATEFGGQNKEKAKHNLVLQQKRDEHLRKMCENSNIILIEIDGRKIVGNKIKEFLIKIFNSVIIKSEI